MGIDRQRIFNKYGGLCAYTGKPLDDLWQIDHMEPLINYKRGLVKGDYNSFNNLVPAIRIINHYKRSQNLEQFRTYMMNFHIRLGSLPKKTTLQRTELRIKYLNKVAALFDITPDKPFTGKFYFEQAPPHLKQLRV